jgi:hypothetical protein
MMINIFPKKGIYKHRFVDRGMYFILNGDHKGSFIINIKEFDTEVNKAFLVMPQLEKLKIPKAQIKQLFESGAIEYVETIPKKVYNVCVSQYVAIK